MPVNILYLKRSEKPTDELGFEKNTAVISDIIGYSETLPFTAGIYGDW